MLHGERRTGVLVGVDGSVESDAAIRWATHEAITRHEPLTLLHVVVPVVGSWPLPSAAAGITEWQLENGAMVLQAARKVAHSAAAHCEPPTIDTELRHGSAAGTLVALSREVSVTVVGTRRVGMVRRVLEGSVSRHVLHHAHGPIVVVHPGEADDIDVTSPVVVGIDGSPSSELAIAWAFDEASRRRVDLIAIHAWTDLVLPADMTLDEQPGQAILAECLTKWQECYPNVTVRRRAVVDDPARHLIEASHDAQLVVLGSRGRGGFASMLLGSVAARVAIEAAAPTMVIRPR